MEGLALYALTGLLATAVFRLRFHHALWVVMATLLWVPGYLLVPFANFSGFHVTRIVFLAFVLSFHHRREKGEMDASTLRPPNLVLAVVSCMLILGAVGIGLSEPDLTMIETAQRWLIFVDQAAMIWIAVVATRVLGARRMTDALLVALGVAIAIGTAEYFVGDSWSSQFPVTDSQSTLLLNPLEQRGGARIRAAAAFALEFGWVVAMLLPLALQRMVSDVTTRWRLVLMTLIASGVMSIVWTRSRSALVAAGAGAVLLLVLAGFRRRLRWPVVAAALVAGTVLLTSDAFEGVFDLERPPEATERDVRFDRLPGILEEVAAEPYTGLGLGGLWSEGYATPDNGWVLLYADTGVVGVATYGTAVVLALLTAARALRGRERELAAAVLAGMVLWPAANAAYDASNLSLSGPLFWLLAGIGVVMAEGVEPARLPVMARALVGGVGAGMLLAAVITPHVAATHVARTYQFQTLPTPFLANTSIDYGRWAFSAEATVCDAMEGIDQASGGGRIDCVEPGRYQSFSGEYSVFAPGTGRMRIEARTVGDLDALERQILSMSNSFVHFELRRTSADLRGTNAGVRTAPVWAPLSLGLLVLFWPRRNQRSTGPEVSGVDPDQESSNGASDHGQRPREPARSAEATTGT